MDSYTRTLANPMMPAGQPAQTAQDLQTIAVRHFGHCTVQERLETLIDQGVGPLYLTQTRQAAVVAFLGASGLQALQQHARDQLVLDHATYAALRELMTVFESENLPCLAFKGLALGLNLYAAPGYRPRSDSDLMVGQADLDRAIRLLSDAGFRQHSPEAGSALEFSRTGPFGTPLVIDLHTRITGASDALAQALSFSNLMQCAVPVASLPWVRTPAICDALLIAAFHRAMHFGATGDRLIWLYDVHLLAEQLSAAELCTVADEAKSLGVASALLDALESSAAQFNTRVPPAVTMYFSNPDWQDASSALLAASHDDALIGRTRFELQGRDWYGTLPFLVKRLLPAPARILADNDKTSPAWLPWLYGKRVLHALSLLPGAISARVGKRV